MILIFACIIAGIIIGICGSAVYVIWRETREDTIDPDYDLADLVKDIQPLETPLMSEIEKHRQKHLAAQGGRDGTTGLRRCVHYERDHTDIA